MEQFLKDLTSTYWWIVLLLSLFISVIAHYIPPLINRTFARFSKYFQERDEKSREKMERNIQFLVKHPEEITDDLIRVNYHIMWAFFSAALSIFFISVYQFFDWRPDIEDTIIRYFCLISATIVIIGWFQRLMAANYLRVTTREARKRLRETQEPPETPQDDENE